jgi:hypothetical protein
VQQCTVVPNNGQCTSSYASTGKMSQAVTSSDIALLAFPSECAQRTIEGDFQEPTCALLTHTRKYLLPRVKGLLFLLFCSDKTGKNSPQKNVSGRMNIHFALDDTLAHFGPSSLYCSESGRYKAMNGHTCSSDGIHIFAVPQGGTGLLSGQGDMR